jgi:hypothetical protein
MESARSVVFLRGIKPTRASEIGATSLRPTFLNGAAASF